MDANRIYVDIFEEYYKKAKEALVKNDYVSAKQSLLHAAEALYRIAKEESGATREKRIQQAEAFVAKAKQMDELIKKAEANKKNPSQRASENKGEESDEGHDFYPSAIPSISFDDVVGLKDVKDAVYKKVIEPRKNPELYQRFKMKVGGGILLYGPPGTGKTMIAEAIAHEVNGKFFNVNCHNLVSKYFGGMEQNIGKLFETFYAEKNAVLFFDEFESIGADRNKNNSTVMARAIPELLTQLQKSKMTEEGKSLLVIAATNTPWALDSAFLRPGRFDERIYVGLPDKEARVGIIERGLKGIPTQQNIDMGKIGDLTEGFNGADLAYVIEVAKNYPIERERKYRTNTEVVTYFDLENAVLSRHSSVVKADLERLEKWTKENNS